MEIHSPDIIGPVEAAGDAGVAGQVLTSAGPAAQVTWATPTDNSFTFTSASAVSHTINHNLGNAFPSITVWNTASNEIIQPLSIVSNSNNQLTVTFFLATAIAGTIVG